MIVLGVLLIILALLLPLPAVILWIGLALAIVGAVLMLHPVGGRRWY